MKFLIFVLQSYILSSLYTLINTISNNYQSNSFLSTEEKSEYIFSPSEKIYRIKSYLVSDIDKLADPIKQVNTQISLGSDNIYVVNSNSIIKNITYYE
jgi:hypothetical protein